MDQIPSVEHVGKNLPFALETVVLSPEIWSAWKTQKLKKLCPPVQQQHNEHIIFQIVHSITFAQILP
jgi:hypothetical protein